MDMTFEDNKKSLIRASTKKILMRALWRALPFPIPGPDLYDLINDLQKSRTSIDDKIDEASESLRKTSELINEIEEILNNHTQKLTTLRQEVERYSQLSEVEEEKAKAIVEQLELTLNKGKIQERWAGFGISIFAGLILFVFGVVFSPVLNQWFGINTQLPSGTVQSPNVSK